MAYGTFMLTQERFGVSPWPSASIDNALLLAYAYASPRTNGGPMTATIDQLRAALWPHVTEANRDEFTLAIEAVRPLVEQIGDSFALPLIGNREAADTAFVVGYANALSDALGWKVSVMQTISKRDPTTVKVTWLSTRSLDILLRQAHDQALLAKIGEAVLRTVLSICHHHLHTDAERTLHKTFGTPFNVEARNNIIFAIGYTLASAIARDDERTLALKVLVTKMAEAFPLGMIGDPSHEHYGAFVILVGA